MDVLAYNRQAWDRNVQQGDRWTVPVSSAEIAAARRGDWSHVAARDGLVLATVQGDMADLSDFAPASFDLIVHPCSNVFLPDVRRYMPCFGATRAIKRP